MSTNEINAEELLEFLNKKSNMYKKHKSRSEREERAREVLVLEYDLIIGKVQEMMEDTP